MKLTLWMTLNSCNPMMVISSLVSSNAFSSHPNLKLLLNDMHFFALGAQLMGKFAKWSLIVEAKYCLKKLINALNLTSEPHPNPYKVNWITKKGETTVTKFA